MKNERRQTEVKREGTFQFSMALLHVELMAQLCLVAMQSIQVDHCVPARVSFQASVLSTKHAASMVDDAQ